MIKYWKILILLVMVLGAIFAVGLKSYPYGRNGVEVVYVTFDSPAAGLINQGDIITHINEIPIKNLDEWETIIADSSGETTLRVNRQLVSIFINGTIGIDALDIDRTNLNLGLDLKGGTRIILQPVDDNVSAETISQVISTLETRSNLYGLQEMKFTAIGDSQSGYFIQVEAAGVGKNIVDDLLSKQGDFEAKVTRTVPIIEDEGILLIGGEPFNFTVDGDELIFGDDSVKLGESIILDEIEFEYINKTDREVLFYANVYTGKDIELVYTDPQRSGIQQIQGGYSFFFTVLISQNGAERFSKVTEGLQSYVDLSSGSQYIDSSIILFLDGRVVSELRISSGLAGVIYTTPTITGSRASLEEAQQERLTLQTVLRSGALPVKLETSSVEVISPTLGSSFFESATLAMLVAGVVVFTIVFVRYRSFKIAIPLVLIALSEVIIILGLSAANDVAIWSVVLLINIGILTFAWWKKYPLDLYVVAGAFLVPLLGMSSWTLDLPAIGGIIAVIGTGVDHQIIIADETISSKKKKQYDTKERIKRAYFIIMGAAATTIAAMIPLAFLGIGLVRGFAITTIVGVLVGILITRPAYARIIERMHGD